MIIGVTGMLGAGKGAIAEFLLRKGFKHYSVRAFLTEEILKRGLNISRDNMVFVANDLRAKFSPGCIVEEMYKRALADGGDAVIESIRSVGEVEALKKNGGILFGIDADIETRYARIVERAGVTDRVSFDEFVAQEQREATLSDPTKGNLRKCIELADYNFKNDWTVEELCGKLEKVLDQISGKVENVSVGSSEGKKGVYSDLGIKDLIRMGVVSSDNEIIEDQIQPSSLDLRLGKKGYCLPFSSVPSDGDFESFLKDNCSYDVDLSDNGFLHKGCVYVFKLQERLNLPENIGGRVNPKSSIGRIDVHVRLMTENGESFDNIPFGYKGDLWLELYPRSFDVIVHEGDCFDQMRLFDSGTKCLCHSELEELNKTQGLLFDVQGEGCLKKSSVVDNGGGDTISVSLELDENNPGFVARHDAPPVDLSRRDHIFSEYFEKIYLSRGNKKQLIVSQNSFYILSSKEIVSVPKDFCSDMADIETDSGEVRVHYAGFFDPNWNAQATLEVRNFGQPFLLKDGQKIASFRFYPMKSSPKELYGVSGKGSHYHKQKGPKLAKYFKL